MKCVLLQKKWLFLATILLSIPLSLVCQNSRIEIQQGPGNKERFQLQKSREKDAKKRQEELRHQGLRQPVKFIEKYFSSELAAFISVHTVSEIFLKDKSLEIENSAGFGIRDEDFHLVTKWNPQKTFIKISPNHLWFSAYTYTITNLQTQESVKANLLRGPFENSPFNRTIAHINYDERLVVLDNGLSFQPSKNAKELKEFYQWQVGNLIIVGVNDSLFSWGYNNILINLARDQYITASFKE
jgi:hypothetical protein